MVALENFAQNKMLTEGRRYWPDNPFEALVTKPQTYSQKEHHATRIMSGHTL